MNCQFCRIETFYGTNKLTAGWIAEHHLGFSRIMISIMVLVGKTSTNEIDHMKDFESMLLAWCCLISRLTTKKEVSRDEIDIYVKIFLFLFKTFEEKTFATDAGNFMWYNRGNFVSLLNLPNQIYEFGSLRYYQEGSRERFIQLVKPFMKNIKGTSSFISLQMSKLYTNNALKIGAFNRHVLKCYRGVDFKNTIQHPHYQVFTSFYRRFWPILRHNVFLP